MSLLLERDMYDQINGFENTRYNSEETILIAGLQHYFTDNIYFTISTINLMFWIKQKSMMNFL